MRWEAICLSHCGGIDLSKHNLYKFLKENGINWKNIISKKLLPDEAYLENGELKIFEKKFQKVAGSVDEKLQTCAFKVSQFRKIANALGIQKVSYTYLLNDWFEKPEYKDALNYINSVEGCSYKIIKEE